MEQKLSHVPVFHCFDHNYVLFGAIAFHSLLSHSNPWREYHLHVVGTGLTEEDKALLQKTVSAFPNGRLILHEPPALDLPQLKGNFSKDLFYKLLVPEILKDETRAIISDVDVVYAGDIAEALDVIPEDDPENLLAGPADITYASWRGQGILRDLGAPKSLHRYQTQYTQAQRDQLILGAGLMTFHLANMRTFGLTQKALTYAKENFRNLILPEQDILNPVCYPHTKVYPPHLMAIAPEFKHYQELTPAQRQDNPAWDEMFAHPIQIHYATGIKPWKYPACPMADLWFDALLTSGLLPQWRQWLDTTLHAATRREKTRNIFTLRLPLSSKRSLSLTLTKHTKIG